MALPAAAQDYVIGLTGALTGPPSSTYAPAVDALRIYLDRVNAGGGINGHKVKLILEDGTVYSQDGTLQFRDVTVDPTTGSVLLRSTSTVTRSALKTRSETLSVAPCTCVSIVHSCRRRLAGRPTPTAGRSRSRREDT